MTPHGTRTRYVHDGCRCDACRSANTSYTRDRRAERSARTQQEGLPAHIQHGVSAYNNWGCRCPICTAVHYAKWRAWADSAGGAS